MTMQTPINAKIQSVKIFTSDKKRLQAAIRVIEYHAVSIESVTMSRRTAQAINGDFIPARPPSHKNPFINDIVVEGITVMINDSLSAGMIAIVYKRESATDDDNIKRKIKTY